METGKRKEVAWNVEGMTCSSCANTVTKFLEKRGMKEVYVDFASGAVKFQPNGTFNNEELSTGISRLGYRVRSGDAEAHNSWWLWLNSLETKFYLSLAFTIPLMLHMLLPFALLHNPTFQLILCLPVFIIGTLHFGKSALGSLKEGVPNMDVLIFTGSTAAFVYSVIGLLFTKTLTTFSLKPPHLSLPWFYWVISLKKIGKQDAISGLRTHTTATTNGKTH